MFPLVTDHRCPKNALFIGKDTDLHHGIPLKTMNRNPLVPIVLSPRPRHVCVRMDRSGRNYVEGNDVFWCAFSSAPCCQFYYTVSVQPPPDSFTSKCICEMDFSDTCFLISNVLGKQAHFSSQIMSIHVHFVPPVEQNTFSMFMREV